MHRCLVHGCERSGVQCYRCLTWREAHKDLTGTGDGQHRPRRDGSHCASMGANAQMRKRVERGGGGWVGDVGVGRGGRRAASGEPERVDDQRQLWRASRGAPVGMRHSVAKEVLWTYHQVHIIKLYPNK